jgi:hypothetical protein
MKDEDAKLIMSTDTYQKHSNGGKLRLLMNALNISHDHAVVIQARHENAEREARYRRDNSHGW